jgi:diacylglycerol kinase (ATP)
MPIGVKSGSRPPSMTGPDLRVVLACNPRSGRGKAVRAAAAAGAALEGVELHGRRIRIVRVEIGPGRDAGPELVGAEALVIAGGDGSVHSLAPLAIETGVPVYHIPCGNENLMAREFAMTASPSRLREALERRRIVEMDAAEYEAGGGRGVFVLMCSLGPDAGVIARLHEARTRALGHAAYIGPILRELGKPRFARVSVRVDGERVVERECGVLIVANSRQYALRIDPAARASVSDGLLDVVFLPCGTRAGVVVWGVRSRLRRQGPRAVYLKGRDILIETEGGAPYQVDGECPAHASGVVDGEMRVRVLPRALRVLA